MAEFDELTCSLVFVDECELDDPESQPWLALPPTLKGPALRPALPPILVLDPECDSSLLLFDCDIDDVRLDDTDCDTESEKDLDCELGETENNPYIIL